MGYILRLIAGCDKYIVEPESKSLSFDVAKAGVIEHAIYLLWGHSHQFVLVIDVTLLMVRVITETPPVNEFAH